MRCADSYKEAAKVCERLRRLGLAEDDCCGAGLGEHEEEQFYEGQMRRRFTTLTENVWFKEVEEVEAEFVSKVQHMAEACFCVSLTEIPVLLMYVVVGFLQ